MRLIATSPYYGCSARELRVRHLTFASVSAQRVNGWFQGRARAPESERCARGAVVIDDPEVCACYATEESETPPHMPLAWCARARRRRRGPDARVFGPRCGHSARRRHRSYRRRRSVEGGIVLASRAWTRSTRSLGVPGRGGPTWPRAGTAARGRRGQGLLSPAEFARSCAIAATSARRGRSRARKYWRGSVRRSPFRCRKEPCRASAEASGVSAGRRPWAQKTHIMRRRGTVTDSEGRKGYRNFPGMLDARCLVA